MHKIGLPVSRDVLEFKLGEPSNITKEKLQISKTETVFDLKRVRYSGGKL